MGERAGGELFSASKRVRGPDFLDFCSVEIVDASQRERSGEHGVGRSACVQMRSRGLLDVLVSKSRVVLAAFLGLVSRI